MQVGYGNIKEAVEAVALTGTAVGKVFEDGEVSLGDLRYAKDVINALREWGDVEYSKLLSEIKDLDEQEQAEVAALFNQKFELPGDSVEEIIEQGLDLILTAARAVLAFVKIGTAVKKA